MGHEVFHARLWHDLKFQLVTACLEYNCIVLSGVTCTHPLAQIMYTRRKRSSACFNGIAFERPHRVVYLQISIHTKVPARRQNTLLFFYPCAG